MHRIGVLIAASVLAAFAGVAAPSAAGAADGGFIGTWVSTDPGDGSRQVQTITGAPNGSLTLRYYDESASVCGGPPARLSGHGFAEGDTLVVSGVLVCVPGGNRFGQIDLEVTYVPGADVLTDPSGAVWTRR
jgi:hypothetical protein